MERTFQTRENTVGEGVGSAISGTGLLPKNKQLESFTIDDTTLTVKTRDGKFFIAPKEEVSVFINNHRGIRAVTIFHGKYKVQFAEHEGRLTDEEWDELFEILEELPVNEKASKSNTVWWWIGFGMVAAYLIFRYLILPDMI